MATGKIAFRYLSASIILFTYILFIFSPGSTFASNAPNFHNSSLQAVTLNGEGQADRYPLNYT